MDMRLPHKSETQSYTLHVLKETSNQEIKDFARALVAGKFKYTFFQKECIFVT